MSRSSRRILFLCYGNPARLDDALGPAFASQLERTAASDVDLEVDYQLNVEHALEVADHDCVVFVDAALDGPEPFSFRRIAPRFETTFTTHSVRPEYLMGLASALFSSGAEGYTLGIRGYQFGDFGENLSDEARKNLDAALDFVLERLTKRDFQEAAEAAVPVGC